MSLTIQQLVSVNRVLRQQIWLLSAAVAALWNTAETANSQLVEVAQPPNAAGPVVADSSAAAVVAPPLVELRHRFQSQELMTSRSGGWLIRPDETPRIIWRDVDEIRQLGAESSFRVRWFDASLVESQTPHHPGRWIAWLEGTAPNGTAFRRAFTFYAIPPSLPTDSAPDLTVAFPRFPGHRASVQWQEHQAEFTRLGSSMVTKALFDNESGAILVAGMMEAQPLGRPARYVESAIVRHDDLHLALKRKLLGLDTAVRGLQPARMRPAPATVLHEGTANEAGVAEDAKLQIDALCRDWAQDSGEPFATVVARRGVIVTHAAFGTNNAGDPMKLDDRCWVASITKTVTALMFSQFVDQGLVSFDDPLSGVFTDYPGNDPHVPTFRQCLNHTSGISGHGDFGGMHNPHLENVILNGIDVNQPGARYSYSGMGFELVAKAMEILAGKSAVRIYTEHLFDPLQFGDVVLGNASSDGEFTAMELAVLAQWVANQGSYGDREFISAQTFQELLPRPVLVSEANYAEDEGLGLHWIRHRRPGASGDSKNPEDLLFSPRTLGHGSFSGCIFLVDPEQQLIVTQVRRQTGVRHAEWSTKFFRTIAEVIRPGAVPVP